MDKNQAKKILRNLSKTGSIILTKHCSKQMIRRNVTTEDILFVLMWGNIENIKKDNEYNTWKIEIKGNDLDGDKLVVQAAVNEEENTIIITVY